MTEVWKDIPSYEGIYQVSNKGRVRTVEGKTTESTRHGTRHWHSRILKTKDTWAKKHTVWCGWRVTLWKDKKPKDYLVHRLEACAFLGYPLDSDLTVNHKDGNRRNNDIGNLEMITREENIRHGYDLGLYSNTMKSVTLEDESGNSLEFPSVRQMATFVGKNYKTTFANKTTVTDRNGNIYRIVRYGNNG